MYSCRYNRCNIERRIAGFTLVEFIVIFLIIMVAAAIAFPVLARTRERCKTYDCLTNMREIGLALQMYCDEYDYRMPPAVPWGSPKYWNARGEKTFQELMDSYVKDGLVKSEPGSDMSYKDAGVFACPSDTGIPPGVVSDSPGSMFGVPEGKPVWMYAGCSYEYYSSDQRDLLRSQNSSVIVPWTGLAPEVFVNGKKQRVGAPLWAIPNPARKAALGEIYFWHLEDRLPDGRIAERNTLFADGHAQRVGSLMHLDFRLVQLKHWYPADY